MKKILSLILAFSLLFASAAAFADGPDNGGRGGMRGSGSRRSSVKETKVTVQECPTCGGSKYIVCPECGGRKAHPCKRCSGLGTKQKAGSL